MVVDQFVEGGAKAGEKRGSGHGRTDERSSIVARSGNATGGEG
jgi:hypothetical protein